VIGDTKGLADVRIAKFGAPEFASAAVNSDRSDRPGFRHEGQSVPLFFNARQRSYHELVPSAIGRPTRSEQKVTLSFTPKELGTPRFSVSIPGRSTNEQISQEQQKDLKGRREGDRSAS